jgi:hypothetical protein
MEKRGKFLFLKVVLIFIVIVIWAGLIFYEQLPGIMRPEIAEKITEFYTNFPLVLTILHTLKIILISLIPLAALFIILKIFVIGDKTEIQGINVADMKKKSKTDLDILYSIVQDKKELKVSSIARLFRIDPELAMEWAKILESGDLIVIEYPDFKGPVIRYKEPENKVATPLKIEEKKKEESTKRREEPVKLEKVKKVEKRVQKKVIKKAKKKRR